MNNIHFLVPIELQTIDVSDSFVSEQSKTTFPSAK